MRFLITFRAFFRLPARFVEQVVSIRHSKICWDQLLTHSVALIPAKYGINEEIMALGDSDNPRSKTIKKIHGNP